MRPNPAARLRVFAFPYAGGGAMVTFRGWAQALPKEVELCPVQLPGRENRLRERPIGELAPLIDELVRALGPLFDRPFAFYGHCLGALIGFELARRLRRDGRREPVRLFVSGQRAPQVGYSEEVRRVYHLSDDELIDELRRLGGVPEEVLADREFMGEMLPTLRADFGICGRYVYPPEPPLASPISVYGGAGDIKITEQTLDAWREQTTGGFSLRMFPGDHFFVHTAQVAFLESLAEDMRSTIAGLDGSPG
ncbi:MAG: thioesterase [Deltaproteobacteria bacterium]|nr:thioesterase [Deltaproteobacteria bacterium]